MVWDVIATRKTSNELTQLPHTQRMFRFCTCWHRAASGRNPFAPKWLPTSYERPNSWFRWACPTRRQQRRNWQTWRRKLNRCRHHSCKGKFSVRRLKNLKNCNKTAIKSFCSTKCLNYVLYNLSLWSWFTNSWRKGWQQRWQQRAGRTFVVQLALPQRY